jgi:hypothetical protein
MKSLVIAAATLAVGLTLLSGSAQQASAAYCFYNTVYHEGGRNNIAQGYGVGTKLKGACKRARQKCKNRLERAYRKGKVPRGVYCKRTAHS